MMIKLLAIAESDGLAYIEDSEGVWLMRPPYENTDKKRVSPESAGRAIFAHGFTAEEGEFPTWEKLIECLWSRWEAHDPNPGQSYDDVVTSFLGVTSEAMLLDYLRDAETELLPQRRFEEAERLVERYLSSERVKSSPSLYNRTLKLKHSLNLASTAKRVDRDPMGVVNFHQPPSVQAFIMQSVIGNTVTGKGKKKKI